MVWLLFRSLLPFQVVKIEQVDCKMSTKNVNNLNTFYDIFGQLHPQEYKPTKKQIARLQLNKKKRKETHSAKLPLPDVLMASPYGPICNAKGCICSGLSLRHTQDVCLIIIHETDVYGIFSVMS